MPEATNRPRRQTPAAKALANLRRLAISKKAAKKPPLPDDFVSHEDVARCAACGGQCCAIYKRALDGGSMPENVYFENWAADFHEDPASYGVEPLFDPFEAHSYNGYQRAEYAAKGINIDNCQYLSPEGTGCLIPRAKRPLHCLEYRCGEWKKEAEVN